MGQCVLPENPNMKTLSTETSNDYSMFKITAGISLVVLLLMGLGWFWVAHENSKKADTYFAKAQDACEQNHLDICLNQVTQALQLQEKPEYYHLKFNVLFSQDKTYESKQTLEKLIQLEPQNAHYYFLMSNIAKTTSDSDLALKSIDKAIQLQSNNGDYQIAKATMLVEQDRRKEAIPIYEQLITKEPRYYHYWDQYALSYANYEEWEPALRIRLRGVQQNPKDYLQYFGLGQVYDSMNKKAEAVSAFRHSLELHPLEDSIAAGRIYALTGRRVPAALENAITDSLPLETHANLSYITADINGTKGRFLLDTGASFSVIFQSKAFRYQLTPLTQVITAETANGFTQAPLTYGSLRLGRQDIQSVRFAILKDLSNPAIDGIIGMDVLGLFRFEIDRNEGLLTLHSQ
jgi:tetratricopeptide (TPR) repeat protein